MSREMRKKARVCYYEPEEPSFDEYVFCTSCGDYAYEYCSIHGPLLVIPDDEIFDHEHKPSHVLDARDPTKSNWTRYVNCSRHYSEQNLVAFQYQGQLYYRTTRIIPRFTELLVFYGSEFAAELNIDLRRYHSPIYTETFVKCADDLSLDYQTQMTEAPTVNINELQNLKTEEFTPKLNERQHQYPSESNSLIIDLDESEEGNEPAEYETTGQHQQSSGTQSLIFNLDLKSENVDSNKPKDTHEKLDEKTVYAPRATHTVNINKIHKNVCPICNVKFTSRSDHINHDIKMHNSNIEYKACTICDYKTTKNYLLKEHIERHGDFKRKCPLSEFETASTLKKPAKNHTAAKDRNVNVDGEQSLKSNIEKPHTCTTCGNKFQMSNGLKRHMKTHNQERAHLCMICKKGFHEKYSLKRHMRYHSREKPQVCIVCNMRFVENSALNRHMKVHTNTQNS